MIPAGWVEPGEDLASVARRETEEETGWRAGRIEPLITYNVLAGIISMKMNTFLTPPSPPSAPVASVDRCGRRVSLALGLLLLGSVARPVGQQVFEVAAVEPSEPVEGEEYLG